MKMNLIISTLLALLSFGCSSEPSTSAPTTPIMTEAKSTSQMVEKAKSNASSDIQKAELSKKSSEKSTTSKQRDEKKPKPKIEKPKSPVDEKQEKKVATETAAKVKTNATPKPKPVTPNPKPVAPKPKPVVKPKLFFPDTLHNYGFINEGDTIRHTFKFINDGHTPLEILDVQVSCGCTIPIYSLEAIQPGRLSKIDVTFLSAGKIGPQLATIDVLTNASNPKQTLYLKGVIR